MRTDNRSTSSSRSAPVQLCLPGLGLAPAPTHRLYFALRPDPLASERAERLAWTLPGGRGAGGRPSTPACLHLSLIGFRLAAPPRTELVAAMRDAAAAVAGAPVEVELDRVETFRGRPGRLPIVLSGDGCLAALSPLHDTLEARLARFGPVRRARSGFAPHLTLFYGERPLAPRVVAAIGWQAREFVLIHGQAGGYDVLGSWPLRD